MHGTARRVFVICSRTQYKIGGRVAGRKGREARAAGEECVNAKPAEGTEERYTSYMHSRHILSP